MDVSNLAVLLLIEIIEIIYFSALAVKLISCVLLFAVHMLSGVPYYVKCQ